MKGNFKRILFAFLGTILFSESGQATRIMDENPAKEDWQCKIVDGEWSCEREEERVNVFSKDITDEQREKTLAQDLTWMQNTALRTGGQYYNDTTFTAPLCKSGKTSLSYNKAEFDTDGTLIASGNVEVFQCDQEIYGQNAIINFNKDKSGIESLVIAGDVIAKQPSSGVVIRTEDMSANLEDKTAIAGQTYFRFFKKEPKTDIYSKNNFTGHMRGYAETFRRLDENTINMTDGYITSGSPYDDAWKLSGKSIDLDTQENMAYIKDGWFKIKDIPVMYVPYFAYPTDDKRRSGFLTPGFVNNENSGWGVSVPYYFNLAPNYDLLFEQIYWSQRGPMENATFRYMNEYFKTQFEGSLVPYDFEDQKTRGAFTFNGSGNYQKIKMSYNYDYVSDSQFYNDFSAGNINLVTKTLLDREINLSYTDEIFNVSGQFLDYGVVDQSMFLANVPYGKLPDIHFDADISKYLPDYLQLSIQTQNTYFYKRSGGIYGSGTPEASMVNAFRSYDSPKVALDLSETWGYFKPSLEVPIRYYQLQQHANDIVNFNQNNVTSVIPIFNIDAGAYFDKEFTSSKGAYTATLLPRLFYTYIPYQDQTDLPLFDTNFTNEQYMQMFQVNRFVGGDRINNANQLTYALEHYIVNQEDGSMLLSAKIGQQIFFDDRMVGLDQGNETPSPNRLLPFYNSRFSPIMGSFSYQVLQNIYASADINYRVETGNVEYQVYQLQYKSENNNIFNISYNNIAYNWAGMTQQEIINGNAPKAQQTITASTILKLSDSWAIAALINYNFIQKSITNTFVGLQYDANSWALRGLIQRSAYTSNNPNDPNAVGKLTNTYVLELELKGLGGVYGANGLAQRLNQINGYTAGQWGV
ncbi:LPS-assembly protein LptD [Pseudofrancisella aestuarii]|uniref:LPS-assembly protein LptD n=1 Tax=Pseudofrancisella aestuarii TaxID=2670347 RepID=A0ABV9TBY8_9GAMM|nr:LPS assembly protein LptD [Pseudofrancisella aestuarii]